MDGVHMGYLKNHEFREINIHANVESQTINTGFFEVGMYQVVGKWVIFKKYIFGIDW